LFLLGNSPLLHPLFSASHLDSLGKLNASIPWSVLMGNRRDLEPPNRGCSLVVSMRIPKLSFSNGAFPVRSVVFAVWPRPKSPGSRSAPPFSETPTTTDNFCHSLLPLPLFPPSSVESSLCEGPPQITLKQSLLSSTVPSSARLILPPWKKKHQPDIPSKKTPSEFRFRRQSPRFFAAAIEVRLLPIPQMAGSLLFSESLGVSGRSSSLYHGFIPLIRFFATGGDQQFPFLPAISHLF